MTPVPLDLPLRPSDAAQLARLDGLDAVARPYRSVLSIRFVPEHDRSALDRIGRATNGQILYNVGRHTEMLGLAASHLA